MAIRVSAKSLAFITSSLRQTLLNADIGVESDAGFLVGGAVACGDDDDTVGTARTIDGCCAGVFQHLCRLDVVRLRNEMSSTINTIDYI